MYFLILSQRDVMCSLNDSLWSSSTPKYFIVGVYGTCCPEIRNSGNLFISGYFLGAKRVYLVSFPSPMLRESLLASSHWLSDFSSVLARLNSMFKSAWKRKMFMSSANSFGVALIKAFWMSFTYMRKSNGPRTDPWGTPQFIWEVVDSVPLTKVNCLRSVR